MCGSAASHAPVGRKTPHYTRPVRKKTDFPDWRTMEQLRRAGLVGGFGLLACFAVLLVTVAVAIVWMVHA